jgi:hypothetical protein
MLIVLAVVGEQCITSFLWLRLLEISKYWSKPSLAARSIERSSQARSLSGRTGPSAMSSEELVVEKGRKESTPFSDFGGKRLTQGRKEVPIPGPLFY